MPISDPNHEYKPPVYTPPPSYEPRFQDECDTREGDPRFLRIVEDMVALHAKKQRDYGTGVDPLANLRASEEWGIPAWQGAMIRACDKIKRMKTFAETGKLANEGMVDAFNDLAVYAILGRILFEETTDDDT